eukprot:GFKZ01002526.1.p1 GENE.GFKZ01002526.1~~GFKZ01002526.1.p1  ORF type:complete len:102 (-),score=1.39 GFKZ01002526.1:197-502(-)
MRSGVVCKRRGECLLGREKVIKSRLAQLALLLRPQVPLACPKPLPFQCVDMSETFVLLTADAVAGLEFPFNDVFILLMMFVLFSVVPAYVSGNICRLCLER